MEVFLITVAPLKNKSIQFPKCINELNNKFYLLIVVGTPTTEITPT